MLTKSSKNQEIVDNFKEQLATGQPFIFAVEDTANPEYKTLCIAQEIETPGSATDEQALFLGWGDRKTLVRCLQNAKVDQFKVLEQKWGAVAPGTVLKGTNVRITESTSPRSWIGEDGNRTYQSPKIYPEGSQNAGKVMVTGDTGEKIYRNTELVLGQANHTFIQGGVPEGTKQTVGVEVAKTFDEMVTI